MVMLRVCRAETPHEPCEVTQPAPSSAFRKIIMCPLEDQPNTSKTCEKRGVVEEEG